MPPSPLKKMASFGRLRRYTRYPAPSNKSVSVNTGFGRDSFTVIQRIEVTNGYGHLGRSLQSEDSIIIALGLKRVNARG